MSLIQKILNFFGFGKNQVDPFENNEVVESITIDEAMMMSSVGEVKKSRPRRKPTTKKSDAKPNTSERKPKSRKPKKANE